MMLLAFQEDIAMSESLFVLTGLPCHYYLALSLERMVLRTEGAASIHHLASVLRELARILETLRFVSWVHMYSHKGFVLNGVVGTKRDRARWTDRQNGALMQRNGEFDGPISGLFFSSLAVPLALPACSRPLSLLSGPFRSPNGGRAGQTTTIWLLLLPSTTSSLCLSTFFRSPL